MFSNSNEDDPFRPSEKNLQTIQSITKRCHYIIFLRDKDERGNTILFRVDPNPKNSKVYYEGLESGVFKAKMAIQSSSQSIEISKEKLICKRLIRYGNPEYYKDNENEIKVNKCFDLARSNIIETSEHTYQIQRAPGPSMDRCLAKPSLVSDRKTEHTPVDHLIYSLEFMFAVRRAFAQGIYHQDLKPANVTFNSRSPRGEKATLIDNRESILIEDETVFEELLQLEVWRQIQGTLAYLPLTKDQHIKLRQDTSEKSIIKRITDFMNSLDLNIDARKKTIWAMIQTILTRFDTLDPEGKPYSFFEEAMFKNLVPPTLCSYFILDDSEAFKKTANFPFNWVEASFIYLIRNANISLEDKEVYTTNLMADEESQNKLINSYKEKNFEFGPMRHPSNSDEEAPVVPLRTTSTSSVSSTVSKDDISISDSTLTISSLDERKSQQKKGSLLLSFTFTSSSSTTSMTESQCSSPHSDKDSPFISPRTVKQSADRLKRSQKNSHSDDEKQKNTLVKKEKEPILFPKSLLFWKKKKEGEKEKLMVTNSAKSSKLAEERRIFLRESKSLGESNPGFENSKKSNFI